MASDSNQGLTDFTSMIKKVQQLQEDVQNTVTISRVLSRHLEKLGVRFWMTRQSLRDPIQEASYTRMLCDIEPLPLVIIVMCLRHLDECSNEDTIDTLAMFLDGSFCNDQIFLLPSRNATETQDADHCITTCLKL